LYDRTKVAKFVKLCNEQTTALLDCVHVGKTVPPSGERTRRALKSLSLFQFRS